MRNSWKPVLKVFLNLDRENTSNLNMVLIKGVFVVVAVANLHDEEFLKANIQSENN